MTTTVSACCGAEIEYVYGDKTKPMCSECGTRYLPPTDINKTPTLVDKENGNINSPTETEKNNVVMEFVGRCPVCGYESADTLHCQNEDCPDNTVYGSRTLLPVKNSSPEPTVEKWEEVDLNKYFESQSDLMGCRCSFDTNEKGEISLKGGVVCIYHFYDCLEKSISHSLAEARREWVEEMRKSVKGLMLVEWIEHGRDCEEGLRPCGAVEHPDRLADRCDIRHFDPTTIQKVIDLLTGDNPERKEV